jgi:hypothetical protein
MRTAVAVVALSLILVLGSREALWRLDHPLAQPSAPSPSGSQVAEVRFMPEGSSVPYGSGVFVRSQWALVHSFQSELAFAGYCGTITARWPSDQRLNIQCELLEGEPHMPSPVISSTSVEVVIRRRHAANPSIERTNNGMPFLPLMSNVRPQRS